MSTARNHKGRFVAVKTMNERIDTLRRAGFSLAYAHRSDAARFGYLSHSSLEWERGVFSTVTGEDSRHYGTAWVSFEAVATGEDRYGQADTVKRSNYIAIRQDYASFPWCDVSYLNLDGLGAFVADLDEDMINLMVGLVEQYPVYSDDAHSELEHEEITASWSDYMSGEVYRELSDACQTMWHALGQDTVTDAWWACVSEDVFGNYPEHHGVEVVWGDVRKRAAQFRPYLVHAYVSHRAGSVLPSAWDWVRTVQKYRASVEGK